MHICSTCQISELGESEVGESELDESDCLTKINNKLAQNTYNDSSCQSKHENVYGFHGVLQEKNFQENIIERSRQHNTRGCAPQMKNFTRFHSPKQNYKPGDLHSKIRLMHLENDCTGRFFSPRQFSSYLLVRTLDIGYSGPYTRHRIYLSVP